MSKYLKNAKHVVKGASTLHGVNGSVFKQIEVLEARPGNYTFISSIREIKCCCSVPLLVFKSDICQNRIFESRIEL